jgi:hypothetical protein
MTDLEELIDTANGLSKKLEKAAEEDKRFSIDICLAFEQMSWEIYRTMNDIKQIKENH